MKASGFILSFLIASVFLFNNCDQSTDPGSKQDFVKQVGGCGGSASLDKVSLLTDSCFTYNFDESLITEFCVNGNCCPDTNRFAAEYDITNSTIDVYVEDIAPNLCLCICNYTMHAEFNDLTQNNYLFQVFFRESDSTNTLLYSENVYRQ